MRTRAVLDQAIGSFLWTRDLTFFPSAVTESHVRKDSGRTETEKSRYKSTRLTKNLVGKPVPLEVLLPFIGNYFTAHAAHVPKSREGGGGRPASFPSKRWLQKALEAV